MVKSESDCTGRVDVISEKLSVCQEKLDYCINEKEEISGQKLDLDQKLNICVESRNDTVLLDITLSKLNLFVYVSENPVVSSLIFVPYGIIFLQNLGLLCFCLVKSHLRKVRILKENELVLEENKKLRKSQSDLSRNGVGGSTMTVNYEETVFGNDVYTEK